MQNVERYLEIIEKPNMNHKITVNPNTGRCTLKLKPSASDIEKGLLKKFVEENILHAEFPVDLTFRGNLRLLKCGSIHATMYTEKNKFHQSFKAVHEHL